MTGNGDSASDLTVRLPLAVGERRVAVRARGEARLVVRVAVSSSHGRAAGCRRSRRRSRRHYAPAAASADISAGHRPRLQAQPAHTQQHPPLSHRSLQPLSALPPVLARLNPAAEAGTANAPEEDARRPRRRCQLEALSLL